MEEMWLARDKCGLIYLYAGPKPYKRNSVWNSPMADIMRLDSDSYPEVQWKDKEPTKVKLVIDKQLV